MTMDVREMAAIMAPEARGMRFRQGVVVGAPSGGLVSVSIAGSETVVTGIRYLKSADPQDGETVWLASDGRDLFVVGALQAVT